MTAERPPRHRALRRALQGAAAGTSLLLLTALVVGAGSTRDDDTTTARSGHHGTVLVSPSPSGGAGPGADAGTADGAGAGTASVALAPGTKIGADGRVVHDHGDLEVTVMLAADGGTEVLGPVRPGASISFVNHTTADQVLTTDDGAVRVDVPLVQLVTVPAPDRPGTYRFVSRTDRTVTADVVVTGEAAGADGPDVAGGDAAAVVTSVEDEGPPTSR
ncbi:hypothetical protein WDZ17_10080 [Pseudokineococcus basanitobsidens]|uniref:Uncharacterized protein n=1 Tax=Pseudokineococcus basanitobsidens TaxID=1926649 RepID=A0ABU8RKL2_9ACTN